MTRTERVDTLFMKGYNCSQTVFALFSESLGMDEATAAKVATGFGSGARKGNICGAVSGAMMVLGLAYGQEDLTDDAKKMQVYNKSDQFIERFEAQMGSIVCKELFGYDISIPEERAIIHEQQLIGKICPKAIKVAVEILETMV